MNSAKITNNIIIAFVGKLMSNKCLFTIPTIKNIPVKQLIDYSTNVKNQPVGFVRVLFKLTLRAISQRGESKEEQENQLKSVTENLLLQGFRFEKLSYVALSLDDTTPDCIHKISLSPTLPKKHILKIACHKNSDSDILLTVLNRVHPSNTSVLTAVLSQANKINEEIVSSIVDKLSANPDILNIQFIANISPDLCMKLIGESSVSYVHLASLFNLTIEVILSGRLTFSEKITTLKELLERANNSFILREETAFIPRLFMLSLGKPQLYREIIKKIKEGILSLCRDSNSVISPSIRANIISILALQRNRLGHSRLTTSMKEFNNIIRLHP